MLSLVPLKVLGRTLHITLETWALIGFRQVQMSAYRVRSLETSSNTGLSMQPILKIDCVVEWSWVHVPSHGHHKEVSSYKTGLGTAGSTDSTYWQLCA